MVSMDRRVLLVDGCDFVGFPTGGQYSFARQMVRAFGDRLALVGICTDDTPVGTWVVRTINGARFQFFGVRRVDPTKLGRPLVPARVSLYLGIRRHLKAIREIGIGSVFVQSPEVLMALGCGWHSICFRFPGVENFADIARYRTARLFSRWIEAITFGAISRANLVLASADRRAIADLVARSDGRLDPSRIVEFPTRVDTEAFRVLPKGDARQRAGLTGDGPIVVSCGRLSWVKGWDLVLQACVLAAKTRPGLRLLLIGDGEDRGRASEMVGRLDAREVVTLLGVQPPEMVKYYLNAADVFAVGSRFEGWSVAMLEALACGKPIISTDVSGASQMIEPGINGLIVTSRDPERFAKAILSGLDMPEAQAASRRIAAKYSLSNLAQDLGALWAPLGRRGEKNAPGQ